MHQNSYSIQLILSKCKIFKTVKRDKRKKQKKKNHKIKFEISTRLKTNIVYYDKLLNPQLITL